MKLSKGGAPMLESRASDTKRRVEEGIPSKRIIRLPER